MKFNFNKFKTINALTQEHVNFVPKISTPNSLSFDNIFNGKFRVAIPLTSSPIDLIINKLKALGYYNINVKENKAVEPKYNRTMNLGKIILKELGEEEKKQYDISRVKEKSDNLYIIISRHPIDVARMSDFKNISSCHGMGKEFWYCAFEEAAFGGAIAYIVNKEDFESIGDLQTQEIFEDNDRNINGITPISRIRLNRYRNKKENYDVLMPFPKQYGQRIDGFEDAVLEWARNNQKDILSKEINMEDFVRKGGSYRDRLKDDLLNTDGAIFNNFFQTDSFSGNVQYESTEDEKQKLFPQYYKQFLISKERLIKYLYKKRFTKYHVVMFEEGLNLGVRISRHETFEINILPNRQYPNKQDFYSILTNDKIKQIIQNNLPSWIIDFLESYNLKYFEKNSILELKFKFQDMASSEQIIYMLEALDEVDDSIMQIISDLKNEIIDYSAERLAKSNWYGIRLNSYK